MVTMLRRSRNSGEFCVPQLKRPPGDVATIGRVPTISIPTGGAAETPGDGGCG